MDQQSVITEEMRSLIGVESEPSIFEIQSEPIRRWAEAIGDSNPLYRDEEYARKSRFGRIVVPPGFLGHYAFPVKRGRFRHVRSPFSRGLDGGSECEYFKPVGVGDVLTATSKLVDLGEKQGRPGIGRMLIQVIETTFRDQQGETVARTRFTSITYEGPTGSRT